MTGLSGCFMATYKIQFHYMYSEKHDLYVDDLSRLDRLPPPHPPSCPKEAIFDVNDFVEIDKRTEEAPKGLLNEPYPRLMRYLLDGVKDTHKSKDKENKVKDKVKDALTKVRVIYKWVTSQHLESMTMPKRAPDPSSPMFQLWRIKKKSGNFAQLVSILCKLADVPCVIIHGRLKGSNYDVGQTIDDKTHYGEWNAVLIGEDWRLINSYWGGCAVKISGGDEWFDDDGVTDDPDKENPKKIMFTCDENYFLTDPRQLISTHLPFSSKWQLREVPISPERFQSMAFLKDRFFDLGMSLLNQENCLIESNTGEVEIFFALSKDAVYHKYYCLLFRQEAKTVQGFYPKYDRYLFIQRPKSDQLSVKIRSPVAGTFRLEVVGMDTRESTPGYDYDWVALYKIKFTRPKERCQPYPDQPPLGWGPGLRVLETGLAPLSHSSGIVRADANGEAEVEFTITDMEKIKDMNFTGKISRGGMKEEKLKDRAVYRIEGDKLIFSVRLPRKGEYALKLFASKGEKAESDDNMCNYMLVSVQKKLRDPFPRGFEKGVGQKILCRDIGIVPLSHKWGLIRTEVDEVILEFQMTKPVEYSCSLVANEIMISESKRLVTEEVDGDIVRFSVRLPKVGSYGFKLIAKPMDGTVFENVMDYIIDYIQPLKEEMFKTPTPSILFINVETPVETPAPDEMPEDTIRNRMDAAIVTQDEEELVKAIEDMKEVAKTTETPRKPKKKKKKKREKKSSKDAEGKTPRDQDKLTPHDEKTPRDENTPRDRAPSEDGQESQRSGIVKPLTQHLNGGLVAGEKSRDMEDEESKPLSNGIGLPPPIIVESPPDEDPDVLKRMADELDEAEDKERAERAKEELARAERELQIIKVKKELTEAIVARELKHLLNVTKFVRSKNFQSAMTEEMKKAKNLIERLQHIRRLLHDVLELDHNTIAEIKGYTAPPPAVSSVVSATLLLLGHYVEETREWINVQHIFSRTGKESVKRRVEEFDINKLQPDIALGAKELLSDLTLDQVRAVSAGAATFYVWTRGVVNEMETRMGEDIYNTRPRTSKSRRARRASKAQSKQNKLAPLTRVDL